AAERNNSGRHARSGKKDSPREDRDGSDDDKDYDQPQEATTSRRSGARRFCVRGFLMNRRLGNALLLFDHFLLFTFLVGLVCLPRAALSRYASENSAMCSAI